MPCSSAPFPPTSAAWHSASTTALDNAGAVIGLLAAALLLWLGVPLKSVFLWTRIPGVLVVLLTLRIQEPEETPPPADKPKPSWTFSGLPPVFKRYLIVLALFTLGSSSNMFLLLRARSLDVAGYQIPLLWELISLVASRLATPLSALSDKLGRIRLITGGWLIYALFYFVLGLQNIDGFWIWPLCAAYGLFNLISAFCAAAATLQLHDWGKPLVRTSSHQPS